MEVETGTYGAKVQSWKRANPRDLLKKVIDEAGGNRDEAFIFGQFLAALEAEDQVTIPKDSFLYVVLEYWHANNFRSLVHPLPRQVQAAQRAELRAAQEERVEETKQKIVRRIVEKIALLDWALPSGKLLRDATGRECAKAGGWLTKVAAKVKPGQKVGAALSEKQVRAIFEG